MRELNLNSDDIEDYFKDIFSEKDFEKAEDIMEKIDEIADEEIDHLSKKEKELIEEFCEEFPRVCKAFDLLDDEMRLKDIECDEDSPFCEKLHKFLTYIKDEYQ